MNKSLFVVFGVLIFGGVGWFFWAKSSDDLTDKKFPGFAKSVRNLSGFQGVELREKLKEIYSRQAQVYRDEEKNLKAWLGARQERLNSWFEAGIASSPERFQARYIAAIRSLSQRYVAEAHADAQRDTYQVSKALPHFLAKWGDLTPQVADLAPAQQHFNILNALLRSLAVKNGKGEPYLHLIEKIDIKTVSSAPSAPRRSGSTVASVPNPFYSKVVVDLTCQLATSEVTELLHQILTNELLIFTIDGFSAEKIDGASPEGRTLKNGLQVKLTLGVLNFDGKKMQ